MYGVFLMAELGRLKGVLSSDQPYDLLWETATAMYEDFDESPYNSEDKSEYDAILCYLDNLPKGRVIKNGDVFDIGQTVNGVSKFLWFNDKWHYFEKRLTREYEYNQKELTDSVKDIHESSVKFLGNILEKSLED